MPRSCWGIMTDGINLLTMPETCEYRQGRAIRRRVEASCLVPELPSSPPLVESSNGLGSAVDDGSVTCHEIRGIRADNERVRGRSQEESYWASVRLNEERVGVVRPKFLSTRTGATVPFMNPVKTEPSVR